MGAPGGIKVQTTVQIKSELTLPDGTKLGEITPMQIDVEGKKVCILHMNFEKPLEPSDIQPIVEAISQLKKWLEGELLVLSGRGPIWLFVAIAHAVGHTFRAIATLDPKLQGAVVAISHTRSFEVGQVVKLPQEVLEKLVQVRT